MSNINQQNLREVIKYIYSQFAEKSIKDFIFTTYDFDVDFFEEYIISYLLDTKRKITTVNDLNEANLFLKNNNVCVYYDSGALKAVRPCTTLKIYPQRVKSGFVFHPKVIAIYGEDTNGNDAAYLIVSSSNLTVSGYGRNQEVFSAIKVESQTVAESLAKFLKTLGGNENSRHKKFINYLKSGSFNSKKNVEFFWNHNTRSSYDSGNNTLLKYISHNIKKNITVISPFFDREGPKNLLNTIGINTLEKDNTTVIIPSKKNEHFNIYKMHYEDLKKSGVEFRELPVDSERFIHAKLIQLDDTIIIGSYNFTSAALSGHNSEAALIFHKANISIGSNVIDSSKYFLDDDSLLPEEEGKNSDNKIFILVKVDWNLENRKVYVEAENISNQKAYSVRFGRMNKDFISNTSKFKKTGYDLTEEFATHLLKNKEFEIFSDGKLCFTGLISELNWEEARPEIACDNFYEAINEWYAESGSKVKKHSVVDPLLFPEDESSDEVFGILKDFSSDVFDNYFNLSKSFEGLLVKLKEAQSLTNETNRIEKLNYLLIQHKGSIDNMIMLLKKLFENNEDKDIIYCWLSSKYIELILEKIDYKDTSIRKQIKILQKKYQQYKEQIENELIQLLGNKNKAFYSWANEIFFKR